MPPSIPPRTFYSPTTFVPPLLNATHGRSVALSASRKDPSKAFRVFALQQGAFDFCDAHPERHLRVWSFEKDGQGRRRYVAASYEAFWHMYARWIRRGRELHFYEVIRERYASKVYFDLEFEWKGNEGRDVEGMVELLMWGCEAVLGRGVGRRGVDGGGVVELDSTTDRKFSRHLVLERVVFSDNVQVGEFVRRVVERVWERDAGMVMVDKGGDKVAFVDMGVYTKNRCFRLVGSSKFGKKQRLRVTGQPANGTQRVCVSRDTFMRSLVCCVGADMDIIGVGTGVERGLGGAAGGRHGNKVGPSAGAGAGLKRERESGLPKLDEYIQWIIGRHNGGIYNVTVVGGAGLVIYAIKGGYKYCGRVQRHHKSNNVILVADVRAGEMHQRCFDPECAGYRSPAWRVPAHVLPRVGAGYIDESIEDDWLCDMMERLDRRAGGMDSKDARGREGGGVE